MGYLLRKADNKERYRPRRNKFVAVDKDEKGVGALKNILTSDRRCRVWSLPSWFPVLLWGITVG